MGLIMVIIGYFLDYRYDSSSFLKDFAIGLIYFLSNFTLFLILNQVLGVHVLNCIFGFGIEIVLLFSLKAYLQNKPKK
tara:strand:- start:2825 stop:3058 length:234 start_codon:yes stop_codon:yes gene_type:complete